MHRRYSSGGRRSPGPAPRYWGHSARRTTRAPSMYRPPVDDYYSSDFGELTGFSGFATEGLPPPPPPPTSLFRHRGSEFGGAVLDDFSTYTPRRRSLSVVGSGFDSLAYDPLVSDPLGYDTGLDIGFDSVGAFPAGYGTGFGEYRRSPIGVRSFAGSGLSGYYGGASPLAPTFSSGSVGYTAPAPPLAIAAAPNTNLNQNTIVANANLNNTANINTNLVNGVQATVQNTLPVQGVNNTNLQTGIAGQQNVNLGINNQVGNQVVGQVNQVSQTQQIQTQQVQPQGLPIGPQGAGAGLAPNQPALPPGVNLQNLAPVQQQQPITNMNLQQQQVGVVNNQVGQVGVANQQQMGQVGVNQQQIGQVGVNQQQMGQVGVNQQQMGQVGVNQQLGQVGGVANQQFLPNNQAGAVNGVGGMSSMNIDVAFRNQYPQLFDATGQFIGGPAPGAGAIGGTSSTPSFPGFPTTGSTIPSATSVPTIGTGFPGFPPLSAEAQAKIASSAAPAAASTKKYSAAPPKSSSAPAASQPAAAPAAASARAAAPVSASGGFNLEKSRLIANQA